MSIISIASKGSLLPLAIACSTLLAVYWLIWSIHSRTTHPLAKVPGPKWASLSRTWFMYQMYRGDYQIVLRALRDKHGPLVRIAPNELCYSKQDGIPLIYRLNNPLEKTDWYHTWKGAGLKAQIDLFTITDEKKHTAYRRLVGGVYSLSNMLTNESKIDQSVQLFLDCLDGFAEREEELDLGLWLEMYAYDNIGSVFFAKRFGFLETSSDYGNYIDAVHRAMPILSVVSMAPSCVRTFLLMLAAVIPSQLKAVLAVEAIRKTTPSSEYRAKTKGAGEFTYQEVIGEMWIAVVAGSDSTAGALRSTFYFLFKNPLVMAKLIAEIDSAYADGTLTHPVQHAEAAKLPYLLAVCKETARIWPSIQVTMPRYAPKEGLQLPNGFFVPAGYGVGMGSYVTQRDQEVFGDDADAFRPERWLEADEKQYRLMTSAMLSLGAGTRTCIGQHLANMEIYKIVPEILRHYTLSMPLEKEWTTYNASFTLTSGINCKIERRHA